MCTEFKISRTNICNSNYPTKKKRLESREEEKSVFLLLYAARELTRMREIM